MDTSTSTTRSTSGPLPSKNAENLTSILDYLRDTVRPMITKVHGPRSCLQTAAVVQHVLTTCGYPNQVLPVIYQFFNDVCARQALAGLPIDVNAPGAFARQVGGGHTLPSDVLGAGWQGAGHVINVIPEFGVMIDFAIDQVNSGNPDDLTPRNFGVLPFYSQPPTARLKALRHGRKDLSMVNTGSTGLEYLITYIGYPSDKSYLTAQTYLDPMNRRMAELAVERIKEALA